MTVKELIQPGDKVDISPIWQDEEKEKEQAAPVYKSKVLDCMENGNLELSMPSERGKLILLSLESRIELVIYTRAGMYRVVGQIKERYKSDNLYVVEVELKTQPQKFQRREYYRFPFVLEFQYFMITKEEAKMIPPEALLVDLREAQEEGADTGNEREHTGMIVDLSGGGIKFRTKEPMTPRQWLLLHFSLKNEAVDQRFCIIASVMSCVRSEHTQERLFDVRARFQIRDANTREEIIRFIFEEERRSRQRSM